MKLATLRSSSTTRMRISRQRYHRRGEGQTVVAPRAIQRLLAVKAARAGKVLLDAAARAAAVRAEEAHVLAAAHHREPDTQQQERRHEDEVGHRHEHGDGGDAPAYAE